MWRLVCPQHLRLQKRTKNDTETEKGKKVEDCKRYCGNEKKTSPDGLTGTSGLHSNRSLPTEAADE